MGSNPTLSATSAEIRVDDLAVRVHRKPIRTLRLTVRSPDGPVRVSVPLRTSDSAIHRFVRQHQDWIRRQQARLAALPPAPAPPTEAERRELAARIPGLLDRWQPVIGVRVTAFRVRHMRTRWGSCNTHDRRISLSSSLARRPEGCLEYVLVHELVHLLERRHNARFYGLLDRFLPDWRERREALRCRPLPSPADPALDSGP